MHAGDPCLWLVLGLWGWEDQTPLLLCGGAVGRHIPVSSSGRVLWGERAIRAPEGWLVTHGHGLAPWDMDVTVPLSYGCDLP